MLESLTLRIKHLEKAASKCNVATYTKALSRKTESKGIVGRVTLLFTSQYFRHIHRRDRNQNRRMDEQYVQWKNDLLHVGIYSNDLTFRFGTELMARSKTMCTKMGNTRLNK